MRVLVGCEYSGTVRDAFIARGHDAISCDLLPTDSPGLHHQGDIYEMLDQEWDLIICHPPCTYLCVAGNKHYAKDQPLHAERMIAAEWTEALWEACKISARQVCFENPLSVLAGMTTIPKANYVQPYQYGHLEQKNTGLHLHNLEPLRPTNDVYDEMMKLPRHQREKVFYMVPSEDRSKLRSKTCQGIADAMAEQWGRGYEDYYNAAVERLNDLPRQIELFQ